MKKESIVKLLTKREYEVLSILWNSTTPLIASEIVKCGENLNINTVQSVLRKLITKEYIAVDEIIYSGTVLTRSYKPLVSREDFNDTSFLSTYKHVNLSAISASSFVANFLSDNQSNEELLSKITELESLIKERKEYLQLEQEDSKI
ncbi:MAG: BlaI/MecI/CopY family transcriptional regulator [Eubacteriales bacterium]